MTNEMCKSLECHPFFKITRPSVLGNKITQLRPNAKSQPTVLCVRQSDWLRISLLSFPHHSTLHILPFPPPTSTTHHRYQQQHPLILILCRNKPKLCFPDRKYAHPLTISFCHCIFLTGLISNGSSVC